MHLVDREKFDSSPLKKLQELNNKYKSDWSIYNIARAERKKPLPKEPSTAWNNKGIREPLMLLFLKNCGYCGRYTEIGNDGHVDHHFPTSLDLQADFIFDWNNYVWSCSSCNGLKSNNYPFLDPCS